MGSHHQNEEFGDDYELPADRAYAETCASIGSDDARVGDCCLRTGERAVRGPDRTDAAQRHLRLAARRWPSLLLRQHPAPANRRHEEETATGLSERAEATLRAPWFEVSCCPTNVSRTLASLPGYVATSDDGGIQLHQYTPMQLDTTLTDGQRVGLSRIH